MLLNNEQADDMRSAIDSAFARLPPHLRTAEIKDAMAKAVLQASSDYAGAAQRFAQKTISDVTPAHARPADKRAAVTHEIDGGRMIPKSAKS